MTINAEKVTKLVNRLATVDQKLYTLQQERETLASEITNIVSGYSSSAAKTTPVENTAPKKKGSLIGDTILKTLKSTPGKDIASLATTLKAEPKQIGLALYHLTKKNQVFSDAGKYYMAPAMTPAMKSTTQEDEDL
jgi:predicted Rossmann fold nucleotide-binding protein DprA/Smf involved in DNA uptake